MPKPSHGRDIAVLSHTCCGRAFFRPQILRSCLCPLPVIATSISRPFGDTDMALAITKDAQGLYNEVGEPLGSGRKRSRGQRTPCLAPAEAWGVEMIALHRGGQRKAVIQDGRSLQPKRRCCRIEPLVAWFQNFHHLVVQHKYHRRQNPELGSPATSGLTVRDRPKGSHCISQFCGRDNRRKSALRSSDLRPYRLLPRHR